MEHVIAAVGVCPSVLNRLRAKRDAMKLHRFSEMESSAVAEQEQLLVSSPGYGLILAVENQSLAQKHCSSLNNCGSSEVFPVQARLKKPVIFAMAMGRGRHFDT